MSETFGLAKVIKTLRKDITEAVRSGEGHDIQFTLNHIEVELQSVIEKSAKGGIKFKILGNGADMGGDIKNTKTHTIKLNLGVINNNDIDPKTKQPHLVKISDEVK